MTRLDEALARLGQVVDRAALVVGGLKALPSDDGANGDRADIEAEAVPPMAEGLGAQLGAAVEEDPSDIGGAVARLDQASEALRGPVVTMLTAAATLGVRQAQADLGELALGIDWNLVNQDAVAWAQSYSYALVQGVNQTSRALLREAIQAWIESGEPLETLTERLAPQFGEVRARLIAETEVTRAFFEGNRAAWRAAGNVTAYRFHTANDERVCDICSPRDGQEYGLGEEGPPLHVRCRCWATPVVGRQ